MLLLINILKLKICQGRHEVRRLVVGGVLFRGFYITNIRECVPGPQQLIDFGRECGTHRRDENCKKKNGKPEGQTFLGR
jgi:hypothetical protein